MEKWKIILEAALREKLPGEESHRKMLPAGRTLHPGNDTFPAVKQSGVLVLIFPSGKELYTCMIRRPAHMKEHAGQIGFPGGKMEPRDAGTRETALREAHEEIGTDQSGITVLGALTPLYVAVSRFQISPWVAWSDGVPQFTLNGQEAEKLLMFPLLSFACNPRTGMINLETVTGPVTVPAISFDGETIWGATAMILTELTDLIRPMVSGKQKR